jgi:hypothetical protein
VLLIKCRISKLHVAIFSCMDPKYTLYAHMDYTRRPD